jgi:hypothetical protein
MSLASSHQEPSQHNGTLFGGAARSARAGWGMSEGSEAPVPFFHGQSEAAVSASCGKLALIQTSLQTGYTVHCRVRRRDAINAAMRRRCG